MARFVLAVAIALAGSCGHGEVDQPVGPAAVRVSAPFGLTPLVGGPRQGGSSAAVLALVLDPIDRHVRTMQVDGSSVLFERLPSAPPIEELVATFRTEEMVSKEQIDEDSLRVVMSSEMYASDLAAYRFGGFERGPFAADPWRPGDPVQRLRALDGRVIELVEMPIEEQWRRLLARDVDVVPINRPTHRVLYEGLESIRLLDVPSDRAMTLIFNIDAVPNVADRRRVAATIDRSAVALVCAGATELSSQDLVVRSTDWLTASEPRTLSIGFLAADLEAADAARVVRVQLEKAGYTVNLQPNSIADLMKFQTDMTISPFSDGPERAELFREVGAAWNYHSARLNDAVERGDRAGATAILEEDVPLIPLYHSSGFAAVDAALCGGRPGSLGDWSWLADLHPCEEVQ